MTQLVEPPAVPEAASLLDVGDQMGLAAEPEPDPMHVDSGGELEAGPMHVDSGGELEAGPMHVDSGGELEAGPPNDQMELAAEDDRMDDDSVAHAATAAADAATANAATANADADAIATQTEKAPRHSVTRRSCFFLLLIMFSHPITPSHPLTPCSHPLTTTTGTVCGGKWR
jgi:hypothetical protein